MVLIVLHYFVLEFMGGDREDDAPGQTHIDAYVDLVMLTKNTQELTTAAKDMYEQSKYRGQHL